MLHNHRNILKAIYKNYFRKNTDKDPILKALENIPIFDNLSEKDLEKIASLTHEREYKKEEQIFKKLAPAEGMYVIVDGEVVINYPETKKIYANLYSGDFFGELALLDDEPRSASVLAQTDAHLLSHQRASLERILRRYSSIAFSMMRILTQRLRDAQ